MVDTIGLVIGTLEQSRHRYLRDSSAQRVTYEQHQTYRGCDEKKPMSTKLSGLENAQVGMTMGVIEVCCFQPLNYFKNMKQQSLPISFDPRIMYRGLGANVVNMGACTMIQFAVDGSLKKLVLERNRNRNMGGEGTRYHQQQQTDDNCRRLQMHEEMGIGIAAGVISAFVASPLTLIMIQQQVKGGSTIDTIRTITTPHHFYRGFVGVAVREGLWTCGYLSFPPVVRRTLRERYPEEFDSDAKARIPAALLGGLFACYLSHPFDTIKTCMQGDIERKTYGTFIDTAKVISKSGFGAFYRGATYRYARMVCAVYLIDSLQVRI